MDLQKLFVYIFIVLVCVSDLFVCEEDNISVVRLTIPYEIPHTLELNSSIEYILDLVPNADQAQYPARLSLEAVNVDTVRPALITARQMTGAVTWQLPWVSPIGRVRYQMQRTICPSSAIYNTNVSNCVGNEENQRGLSVQISTTCAVPGLIHIQVNPIRDWNLVFQSQTPGFASETAPRTFLYTYLPDQDNVRLVFSSEDIVCALISIQNYTCPIYEDEVQVTRTGQRMTMMRSAGVQLSRKLYPVGFYVVMIVLSDSNRCVDEPVLNDEDWLWNEALFGQTNEVTRNISYTKNFVIHVEPALTTGQYAVASVVTLVVFLAFYILALGFILAQNYEPFRRLVEPAEPPAEDRYNEETTETIVDGANQDRNQVLPMRRRASTDTLDRSYDSDSDIDDEDIHVESRDRSASNPKDDTLVIEVNGTQPVSSQTDNANVEQIEQSRNDTPFGLPAQLNLGVLSRHRAKIVRVRSDRYLWTLITVATFYGLPVVQFVITYQIILNVSGSLDLCYYNFLCAHPAGQLSDFNHLYSNIGYLMLGTLFIVQVYRRRRRRKNNPIKEEYGIPPHYGLLNALGAGMIVVALLSASYHVCPNRLNFQFDTAFMYVLAVIMMVKIYQSRHPDVNARAHATFGVLAVMIALGVWGVLGGGAFFWALFTVVHIFTFLLLSLRIYYLGHFKLEKETLQRAARDIASIPKHGFVKPVYKTRLVLLALANCVNWSFAFYGLWSQTSDFASHLLQILLGNSLLYMMFYLIMKLIHGERLRWYSWCFLAGATASWVPGLYFFLASSSDWSATPAESRHRNHECKMLEFYDNHDLWHFLSAMALYFTFNTLLTWDDGMTAVKRIDIAVF